MLCATRLLVLATSSWGHRNGCGVRGTPRLPRGPGVRRAIECGTPGMPGGWMWTMQPAMRNSNEVRNSVASVRPERNEGKWLKVLRPMCASDGPRLAAAQSEKEMRMNCGDHTSSISGGGRPFVGVWPIRHCRRRISPSDRLDFDVPSPTRGTLRVAVASELVIARGEVGTCRFWWIDGVRPVVKWSCLAGVTKEKEQPALPAVPHS